MRNQGGKRHYEILISMIVISLVALVFYVWVERLAVKVEQSRIQFMISNLRSVIKIHELTVVVAGGSEELADYQYANPASFLGTAPPEYLGEVDDIANAENGSWVFDRQTRKLVYTVISVDSNSRHAEQLCYQLQYFVGQEAGNGRLRLIEASCKGRDVENE